MKCLKVSYEFGLRLSCRRGDFSTPFLCGKDAIPQIAEASLDQSAGVLLEALLRHVRQKLCLNLSPEGYLLSPGFWERLLKRLRARAKKIKPTVVQKSKRPEYQIRKVVFVVGRCLSGLPDARSEQRRGQGGNTFPSFSYLTECFAAMRELLRKGQSIRHECNPQRNDTIAMKKPTRRAILAV
jgi:hypothetical protein